MASINKVKLIDQKPKDLMFGYIRKSNEDISYTTTPMMIKYICLLYYYLISEQFVKCDASDFQISSSEKNGIGDTIKLKRGYWCTRMAHGNIIINPVMNPNLIATWTLKISEAKCGIGIHSKYDSDQIVAHYGWFSFGTKFTA